MKMKKQYKILLIIFLIEICIVSVMDRLNIQVQSWIGNMVGVFAIMSPIVILLFFMSKDEKFSKTAKLFFKIGYWFIIICYLLGGIAKFMYE